VRKIVDGHLTRLDLKRPALSNRALRHTGATLAYQDTRDLRAVQDLLGHADPRTAAPALNKSSGGRAHPPFDVRPLKRSGGQLNVRAPLLQ
jgi:integrase